ncbi:MAG: ABC transporter permease [Anaerofustis stercorihominis]|nr:ABC transporter permease [Anaerofustis stercorihominis]
MRRYSITYFIGQSVKGMWRNGIMTLASITVLMSCLVVMGSFAALVENINYNLENFGEMNSIVAFVELDRSESQVTEIYNTIQKLDNIKNVTLVSKEQALEEEREKYPDLVNTLLEGDNPFPDSFEISFVSEADLSTLVFNLEHIDGIYEVSYRSDLADTISNIKSGVIIVFMWFLIILFVVSVFVIINTIKMALNARKQEITIMRYIGATNYFITFPFIIEGFLIGLISSGIAYLIQWYIYLYAEKIIAEDIQMISVLGFNHFKLFYVIAFVGIGVVTGIIGSCISLRKYLRA